MKTILLSFLFIISFAPIYLAQNHSAATSIPESNLHVDSTLIDQILVTDSISPKQFRKMKITAVTLAVTLGVFGVHRLYLGTSPRIPITYTLTLGGGFFVLPAIDIVYIISAKSPNQLTNNTSVFMWNKTKKDNL